MDNQASISVSIRARPFSQSEKLLLAPPTSTSFFTSDASLTSSSTQILNAHRASASAVRSIVRVVDDRVLVFDPPETNPNAQLHRQLLGPAYKKVKDIRFCFDKVYGEVASQRDVYNGSAREMIQTVLNGFNSTVFAYGATGCGKTHTISGSPEHPGIVFLLMKDLFDYIDKHREDETIDLTVSYLEVYNETIRDLLVSSGTLNLREHEGKIFVPGLSEHSPKSAEEVVEMIQLGNVNRTISPTDANAVSSRSHGVLSVNVRKKARTADITEDYVLATLSVIDLAGSERASVTKNRGERLLEGANINRSLLALGNCINALCDPRKSRHVPYRDSKLTRLLKHSLGGNCKTSMIVCISPSSQHYDETYNTLQYANRAKEIKTKISRNTVTVDRHVSQYVRVIFELRQELEERKKEDGAREEKIRQEERDGVEHAQKAFHDALANFRQQMPTTLLRVREASRAVVELVYARQIVSILMETRKTLMPTIKSALELQETSLASVCNSLDTFVTELSDKVNVLTIATSSGDTSQNLLRAVAEGLSRHLPANAGQLFQNQTESILNVEVKLCQSQGSELAQAENCRLSSRIMSILYHLRVSLSAVNTIDSSSIAILDGKVSELANVLETLPTTLLLDSGIENQRKRTLEGTLAYQYDGHDRHLKKPKQNRTAFSSPVRKAKTRRSPKKPKNLKSAFKSTPQLQSAERKTVIWRDEAAAEWKLEEPEGRPTDDPVPDPFVVAKNEASVADGNASGPLPSLPVDTTINNPNEAIKQLDTLVQNVRSRMTTGFLSRKFPNSLEDTEDSLEAENHVESRTALHGIVVPGAKPFAFLATDPSASSCSPFVSIGNQTVSPSSLPLAKKKNELTPQKNSGSKRGTSVGPVRSTKMNRRLSFLTSKDGHSSSSSSRSTSNSPANSLPLAQRSREGAPLGSSSKQFAQRHSLAPSRAGRELMLKGLSPSGTSKGIWR